ncbi:hypothetical protein MIND_01031000 [Mycena indigotica]|uniref:Uncharacterized protein n=1 Tax=Mycena indigotica TaxID=2126181 RepID=A0A8H6VV05_9AGAR|nr:uncharacterized protein MIND_01031000 [Mycena indigotica]KAF7294929.1 hypothetical protein MIND_01031000 [Mycena indigotica]
MDRLQIALDALDTLRLQYAQQSAAQSALIEKHNDQLSFFRDVARVAEFERDNLRDAVIELAERVESSQKDFFSLPRPRLFLPQMLQPLSPPPVVLPSETDSDLWAYASATIVALRSKLTAEQQAHAETRRITKAQIAILEAQLARREADLAAAGLSLNPRHHADEEIAQTEAINVRLAAEVAQLAAKVEEMQATSSRPPVVPPIVLQHDPDRTIRPRQRASSAPSSNFASDFAKDIETLGRQIEEFRITRAQVAHSTPNHPARHSPVTENNDHIALEREIAELGAQVDALRDERALLREQILASPPITSPASPPTVSQLRFPRPPTPGPRHTPELPPETGSPSENGDITRPNLLEWDGEQSMDLATPLVPSLVLPDTFEPIPPPDTAENSNYALLPTAGPSPILEYGSIES